MLVYFKISYAYTINSITPDWIFLRCQFRIHSVHFVLRILEPPAARARVGWPRAAESMHVWLHRTVILTRNMVIFRWWSWMEWCFFFDGTVVQTVVTRLASPTGKKAVWKVGRRGNFASEIFLKNGRNTWWWWWRAIEVSSCWLTWTELHVADENCNITGAIVVCIMIYVTMNFRSARKSEALELKTPTR